MPKEDVTLIGVKRRGESETKLKRERKKEDAFKRRGERGKMRNQKGKKISDDDLEKEKKNNVSKEC